MICPSCATENPEGTKFCIGCGTPVAARCPACGVPHPPGQRFCGECGAALSLEASAPVPPVSSAPAPATAEMRLVSVLFVDLVGFTSLSEGREAEDVRELLGRYFDSARTIVERYGGTIEKFIGDAVMAVWGVPMAREDDAERAVRAALDVVDSVGVLGAELGASELKARAGVVTGQVAALENPGEGLVVGDRVNTASRVQSAAAPGSVFVDEVTRGVTTASIVYEDEGEHTVKGKSEPLRLWRAVRVVAGVAGKQREEGLEAPFVGRDADLRLLKELFHAAQERRSARLVAVFGEAGIGKSRLLREFSNYTDGLAGTVLWHSGRCLSYGEGVAYWALAEMVRQRLGIPEDAPPQEASGKLSAGLERWVPDPADRDFLKPRLGALIGIAEPGLEREDLFAGWRMFFERLAEHEPVALIFEDMQWADDGLLEFIGQMLDWSAHSPIFLLTLARPELAERHGGWPAAHRGATLLRLEPLDEPQMGALLASVVENLPAAATERIVAQAEGVPLYAIETLRALQDRGVVVQREGRLALEGEVGELDVPASLGSLLAARLDALAPAERQLVKAMSVFGGSFPRATAAALSDVGEDQLDAVLAALVRKQVLTVRADPLSPDRGQFIFAQGLLRTVAYEMLSRQERKSRHLAAAAHMRGAFPNDGEEVAEVIAGHLLDAHAAAMGDADAEDLRGQAVTALRRAAHRAATVGAPETAQRNLLRARELAEVAERTELTEAAAEMAMTAGRSEQALSLFEEAAQAYAQAGRPRDAARATGRCGGALLRIGRDRESIERFRAALDGLGDDDLDAETIAVLAELGRALGFAGEVDEAVAVLERALAGAAALELPGELAAALEMRGVAFMFRGRAEEARILVEGAVAIAERHNMTYVTARARTNASFLRAIWDLPGAEEWFEAAIEDGRRRGNRYNESTAASGLADRYLFKGRWDEAEKLVAGLLGAFEDRTGGEDLRRVLTQLYCWRGRVSEARELLGRLTAWEESDDAEFRANLRLAKLLVYAAEGRHELAFDTGTEMLTDVVSALGAGTDSARIGWPETLRSALAIGRLDAARELLDLLRGRPRGYVPPYLHAELARGEGLVAAAEGRDDEVEAQLGAAVEHLRELDYPYRLALAQADLAEWLIGQARGEEATELLTEAIGVLQRLGATPALERARALLPAEVEVPSA